jgi:hypothetical protein
MNILSRARDIIMNPKVTWQVVKDETVDIKHLIVNYAAPLALIPTVCSLIGMTLIGMRMPDGTMLRAPFLQSFLGGIVGYALHLGGLLVAAWFIKLLAPFFKARADLTAAMKVVVFSMSPVWLVGVFSLIPGMGIIGILGLYSIYLLALGLGTVLDTPSNKVILYMLSILAVSFVISMVLSMVVVGLFYGPMFMQMMAV